MADAIYNFTWDNFTDSPPPFRCQLVKRVFEDIINVLLCCCGIPGNVAVIFVVLRVPSMRSVTNVLLVNLAIGDLTCLVPNVIFYFCRALDSSIAASDVVVGIVLLNILGIFVSLNTLLVISLERYLAVCKTLFHRTRFVNRKRNMVVAVASIWLLAIMLLMPYYMYYFLGVDTHEISTYLYLSDFALVIILMTLSYSRIIITLKKTRALGSMRVRSSAVREKRVVILCFMTALLSTLCMLPWVTLGLVQVLGIYYQLIPIHGWISCLAKVSNFCLQANSCINPYIYNIISSKYRRAFREAFCCEGAIMRHRSSYLEKQSPNTSECGLVSESRPLHRNGIGEGRDTANSFELRMGRQSTCRIVVDRRKHFDC
ncbi:neuropeptides B/W receptor type 2-like [Ptychodera flava]|uniref:neuropeptides B/W receptor type 2-like n=1 Tax=Ptychodera flava TaxID=63121 RepID=UPI00396A7055